MLKRLVIAAVAMAGERCLGACRPTDWPTRARIYVRLRRSDHALLRERAAGRGVTSATYVSMLVRTHLRGVSPLPDREFEELSHYTIEPAAKALAQSHPAVAAKVFARSVCIL